MDHGKVKEKADPVADVVVIGAGGAGLPAAIAAAERGAKVVLIEKQQPGGNAVFALGIFAAESCVQERLGVVARRDDLFRKAMDYAHWKNNPRVVRALVDKSGETIEWLQKKGLPIDLVVPLYPNQDPMVCHISTSTPTLGATAMRLLAEKCKELGVRVITKTSAKTLLTDGSGKITGVVAEKGGEEIVVGAKAVVLATGGFLGNTALVQQYVPSFLEEEFHYTGKKHAGDGVRMATEVGAATEGMAILEMEGPSFPWSRALSVISMRPNAIWINRKGERFADESMASNFIETANAIYRQPGKVSYTLFDESIKQAMFGEELSPLEGHLLGGNSLADKTETDLRIQADKGRVKISHSLEEIALWIGARPETMKAEVDEYNRSCAQGHDASLGKEKPHLLPLLTPPYYAIRCCIGLLTTHGGIKVNHRMEAVNEEDDPIPGLYAAGVEIGGTDFDTYNINLTAHSFGFSVSSGRIAGENAAERALRG